MTKILWDQVGDRLYETGVDRGVLYIPNNLGVYDTGYAWNGLTTVTETPSGADSNPSYADNIKYLNLLSIEEFGGTIEAYTYPDAFAQCDGSATLQAGITIGQQARKTFGLSYRTLIGNDVDATSHGYKLHIVYGALASPSERAYASINDSPSAIDFSWDFTTVPLAVGTINGVAYKPVALMTIDSTKVNATALADLEDLLYGTAGTDPSLPTPGDVYTLFSGTISSVTPTVPTYDSPTHTITIPTVTGVTYRRTDTNAVVTGTVVLSSGQQVIIKAYANAGYVFPANTDTDWQFSY